MRLKLLTLYLLLIPGWAVGAADVQFEATEAESTRPLAERIDRLLADLPRPGAKIELSPPASTAGSGKITITPGKAERKTHAGVSIIRTPVTIESGSDVLLEHLSGLGVAGYAFTPPLKYTLSPEGARTEIVAWRIEETGSPTGLYTAGSKDLEKLYDNLNWFVSRHSENPALLRLLQIIVDNETVRIDKLLYSNNKLVLSGAACDRDALRYFRKKLSSASSALARPPEINTEGIGAPSRAEDGRGDAPGLRAIDLDPAFAMVVAAGASRKDMLMASRAPSEPVRTNLASRTAAGLLYALARQLGLQHRERQGIEVFAPRLKGPPPPATMFSGRQIDLMLVEEDVNRVLTLLAEVSRADLVSPEPSRHRLTTSIRQRPARAIATLILWSLDMKVVGRDGLYGVLGNGREFPRLEPDFDLADRDIDFYAVRAPLDMIVAGLTKTKSVVDCGPAVHPLTVKIRQAPANEVLRLLLASRLRRLVSKGKELQIHPVDSSGSQVACPATPAAEASGPTEPGLVAVLHDAQSQALVVSGSRRHWLCAGDKFEGLGTVKHVRGTRLVVKKTDGGIESLSLEKASVSRGSEDPATTTTVRGPIGFPLARLRLAATLCLEDLRAAVVVDPRGRSHLVAEGNLIGRKCGKLTEVKSGYIEVSLGCPAEFDPCRARLFLMPAIAD